LKYFNDPLCDFFGAPFNQKTSRSDCIYSDISEGIISAKNQRVAT
jgi:hypothetical protein